MCPIQEFGKNHKPLYKIKLNKIIFSRLYRIKVTGFLEPETFSIRIHNKGLGKPCVYIYLVENG